MPQAGKQPGSYALILRAKQPAALQIGKRGEMKLLRGYYVYVGSAFGPGGLYSRLQHHRHITNRPHWHIDYLRKHCELIDVWYTCDQQRREHDWAQCLLELPDARIPLPGFGSSDCRCPSHLVYFTSRPDFLSFTENLFLACPQHDAILSEQLVTCT